MSKEMELKPTDFDEEGLDSLKSTENADLETSIRSLQWQRSFDAQLLRDHPATFALKRMSRGLAKVLDYEPVRPKLEGATFSVFSILAVGGTIAAIKGLKGRNHGE